MADGRLNKCKECVKSRVKVHRSDNLDAIRAYDRGRGSHATSGYLREYRQEYPKKYKAHNAVNNALRDGKMFKPEVCEQCDTVRVVGHHDDYDKPLEVRWLCQACHAQWHSIHGEAANSK